MVELRLLLQLHIEKNNMKTVYLLPGEFYVTADPCILKTVLGSCVAVVLFDFEKKIAGMVHYLLPSGTGKDDGGGRYGDQAIQLLLDQILIKGADRKKLKAQIIGGGEVLSGLGANLRIGVFNIELAERVLKELQIPVVGRDVGGAFSRVVSINTRDMQIFSTRNLVENAS